MEEDVTMSLPLLPTDSIAIDRAPLACTDIKRVPDECPMP
jgi:hypothetical protein